MKVLFTRPNHDDTTHYLYHWSAETIEFAKKKGFTVLDLKGDRANKVEVSSILSKKKPSFVVFNGHGSSEKIFGYKNEPILSTYDNIVLLKDKIVYAITCKSAKELGRKSVSSGTKSFIGYEDDFVFFYEPNMMTRPLQDKTARIFLEPAYRIVFSLLKGHSTRSAWKKSQELFKEYLEKLLVSGRDEDIVLARYLWWDMKNQVCLGDDFIPTQL